jgi:tripartite-type tricarboxylate transporter receptor subunit TctC
VVQKLGKAVQAAVNEPAVKQKLLQLGLEPAGTTPEAFAKFVQDESARVSALVKARNIRVD